MEELDRELMDQNTLYLAEVTADSAQKFIKSFWLLTKKKTKPKITVIINSEGGDYDEGKAIYDLVKGYDGETSAIVIGQCCSIAVVVLQAFKDRAAAQSSVIMVHDGTQEREDKARDFESAARQSLKDRQWMYRIFAGRAGRTSQFWAKRCALDTYFNAREALRIGLIDRVI